MAKQDTLMIVRLCFIILDRLDRGGGRLEEEEATPFSQLSPGVLQHGAFSSSG